MNVPQIVSAAWGGMLGILLAMLVLDLLRETMADRQAALPQLLASDPGPRGLRVLVCLIAVNAVMQPVIHLSSSHVFRVTLFAVTALYTLFFLAHHLVHAAQGEGPGLHTVLDLAHHVTGAIGTWAAWAWLNGG